MVSVALKIVAAIIAAVLSVIIIVVIIVVATSGKDTGTIFLTVGQNNFGNKIPIPSVQCGKMPQKVSNFFSMFLNPNNVFQFEF